MQGTAPARFSAAGTLAAVGALALWTLAPNAIKYLTGYFDFWSQNAYRYLAATLSLLPVLVWHARRGAVDRSVWRRALLPSFFNVAMQCFWAASLYYVNPGFMNLLIKSAVFWTALFSMCFFVEERALLRSVSFWCGLGFSVTGVVGVILSRPDFAAEGTAAGTVCALSAGLLWAAYVVSAKAAFRRTPSQVGFAVICIYTTFGLTAAALVFSRRLLDLPGALGPWVTIVVSGVLCIAVAHVLYYAAQKRIGATIPSVILLASPFTILAISAAAFGERLLPAQWLWGSLLVAGCAVATLAQVGDGAGPGQPASWRQGAREER